MTNVNDKMVVNHSAYISSYFFKVIKYSSDNVRCYNMKIRSPKKTMIQTWPWGKRQKKKQITLHVKRKKEFTNPNLPQFHPQIPLNEASYNFHNRSDSSPSPPPLPENIRHDSRYPSRTSAASSDSGTARGIHSRQTQLSCWY